MTNFEDLDKVFFFGEEFSQIIDEKIQGLSAENQSDQIIMPVITKKGYMLMKKIWILWYPSIIAKNRYLIKFLDES